MKATTSKFSKAFLGLAVLSSTFAGAIANDAVLNSDPININGYVQEAPATDHELEKVKNELRIQQNAIKVNKEKSKNYKKLVRTTEKLADVTEETIEDRKESQAAIDQYNKKIKCLMGEETGEKCDEYVKRKSDTVNTKMAAPAKTEANITPSDTLQLGNVIKVLPYAGLTAIQSQNEELEANVAAGIRVESDITSSFSIGLGFNYTSLTTTDFANGVAGYTPDLYRRYTSFYGAGREIEYTNMNFDLYSKYFFTKTSRFRPYLGAGLAYNRTSMRYTDNRNFQAATFGPNIAQFGDEELNSNSLSMRLMGGSEILFTKNIGMNLELQYSRGLGEGFGNNERVAESPDFRRLRNLNDEINEANIFSVFAGVLVLF